MTTLTQITTNLSPMETADWLVAIRRGDASHPSAWLAGMQEKAGPTSDWQAPILTIAGIHPDLHPEPAVIGTLFRQGIGRYGTWGWECDCADRRLPCAAEGQVKRAGQYSKGYERVADMLAAADACLRNGGYRPVAPLPDQQDYFPYTPDLRRGG